MEELVKVELVTGQIYYVHPNNVGHIEPYNGLYRVVCLDGLVIDVNKSIAYKLGMPRERGAK